ncbi:MAG: hypothetical protein ACM3TR_03635 [Caulobacteraceae bacterium]
MATVYSQLSLADIYKDCQDLFLSDKPAFFSLLENYIDFEKFIPPTFYNAFYQNFGRKRKYPLHAFIASLIFQKVATITLHPNIHPHTFLGDAAFDKLDHYTFLRNDCKFQNMLIPLNPRNSSSSLPKVGYNEFGYPLCPEDSSLVMKYHGITNEKGRSNRVKWGCPKVRLLKGQWVCDCPNPCSTAKRGRTTYTNDSSILRNYPGVQRGTPQWDKEYKNRAIIEQTIQHLKGNMCIANRKTSNPATTKADVYLACIASLFTVILADRLKKPEYIRSMKPLIA